MNSKLFLILYFVAFSFRAMSQEQYSDFNFIFLVDDKIIETGIYDGFFFEVDKNGNTNDSIPFSYQVGDLKISLANYKKIISLNPQSKILIKFKYRITCPEVKEYIYEDIISAYLLNQRYVIFKIYNFENKKNYKNFKERQGYGIEINSPSGSLILPRKKIIKSNINCN